MRAKPAASPFEEYLAEFPPQTRRVLEEVRELIKAAAPEATESISYAIPTFDLHGRHLVHFAGFTNHVGFYPTPAAMEAFEDDLKPYKRGKGSVRFPLDRPLPVGLIRRMVEARVAKVTGKVPG